MFNETTIAIIILIVAVVAFPAWVYFSLIPWLADNDMFFTRVKEGTVKAIVRGNSLDHFVMSFKGYHLNDPLSPLPFYRSSYEKPILNEDDTETGRTETVRLYDWQVLYHGKDNPYGFDENLADKHYDVRHKYGLLDWLLKHFGCYWVGMPWTSKVYVYEFEWNEPYTNKNGEDKVYARDESADYIFVSDFLYAIKTAGAETKDLLSVDVLTLVTIAVRNPYLALFGGEDWMMRVTSEINAHVRNFVGNEDYKDLITKKGAGSVDEYWQEKFSQDIIALTKKLPGKEASSRKRQGLEGIYGIVIRFANLQTMEFSNGVDQKVKEASTKAYITEQESAAKIVASKADATVIENIGRAQANALKSRIDELKEHPDGYRLAQFDAIVAASKNPGSQIIHANDMLAPLVARVLKPSEEKGDAT